MCRVIDGVWGSDVHPQVDIARCGSHAQRTVCNIGKPGKAAREVLHQAKMSATRLQGVGVRGTGVRVRYRRGKVLRLWTD